VTPWKRTLIDLYLSRNALARGTFTLAGGGTSDFYIDGRLVTTHPVGLRAIAHAMAQIISAEHLLPSGGTLVAPVLSGVPIVVALGLELKSPFVIDRGVAKSHGLSKRFEGHFNDSKTCLLIDDLITIGSTATRTIAGLREIGKEVSDAVVLVDREEGAREALQNLQVRLHALLTKSELMAALEESGNGK